MAHEKSKKPASTTESGARSRPSAIGNDFSVWLRRGVLACGVVVGIGTLVFFQGIGESYLMRDSRFHLARAQDYGEAPPNLQIEGLHHASREAVQRVFESDLGRSVYLLPVKQRRLELMGIPWVQDATVSRLWPNRVSVRIQERKPLAFVKRRGGTETTLIDGEGVLMDAPPASRFALPVVEGVGPDVDEMERKDRMHRVERLIKDLQEKVEQVAEIDVTERDNLKVVQELQGRAVTLVLGKTNFRLRYTNFIEMSEELLRRLPNAVTFDLRLEDQVTAAADAKQRPIVERPLADIPVGTASSSLVVDPLKAEVLQKSTPEVKPRTEHKAAIKSSAKKNSTKKNSEKKSSEKKSNGNKNNVD